MSQPQQDILRLEGELPGLKQKYEDSLSTFLTFPQDNAHVTDRRRSLQEAHAAGTNYFNACERLVALGAVSGADKDPTWYTDKAETAADLLEVIGNHFKMLFVKSDELHLSRDMFRPSSRAYSNLQRLVKKTDQQHAAGLRERFADLGIPTHGFDKDESEKPRPHTIEWRFFWVGVGLYVVALALLVWGFYLGTLTPDQRFLLQWVFPLAGGFFSWSLKGKITASTNSFYGWIVTATGGIAIWLLTFLMLHFSLPPK